MNEVIKNRYEFVLLFDVKNGNPNGDPDGGNLPRIDPETGHGITTDVCIKRKIRNYVDLVKGNVSPYEIHVREGAFLSEHHKRAHQVLIDEKLYVHVPLDLRDELNSYSNFPDGIGYENDGLYLRLGVDLDKAKKAMNKIKDISDASKSLLKELFVDSKEIVAKKWMCKNFFDVRTFGAVMSTGDKTCGQVRGPVQFGFSRTIDPIVGLDIAMFRTAAVSVDSPTDKGLGARKAIVPYGLYRIHGFISAPLAKQTGFSEEDLELFWDALINMFDHDHSATRGEMASQQLIIFKHESALGNAPARKLFDLVTVKKNDSDLPARSFKDYAVTVGAAPSGVEIIEKL
ncbi:MAG: type I-C CRISPR-associated protein Cas7/Csd2 [Desulfuromonas sp.]|nr:type I-C CRISPR-associated protein Cas7/Csd2 [Desulfuromonas sp.]